MAMAARIEEEDEADGWAEDNDLVEPRFERIGGMVYAMGSPGYKHQISAGRIFSQLDAQLGKHGCMTIMAPFDVYPLYDQGDRETFVQPDLFVFCDRSRLRDNHYEGVPAFIPLG